MKVVRILLLALCANFALDGCTGCSKNPNIQNKLKAEGDACAKDDECESGVCDAVGDDAKTCLRTCNEGCDPTDVCTPLADADRYVCLPEKPGLCQTCQLDEDCPYPADRCLIIGGTKMCGRDCSNPQDGVQQCPSSYRCADATDANGGLVTKQCQPISGTCECTSASVGQTKPCSESNSYGTCMGQQTCQPPNGYTACSAPVPAAESCNGKDDDCNGQVDEGLGETSCGIGACRRTSANCINGQPATCMPGAPTVELCDGIDSNCDGIVDTDIAQAEICDGLDNDCDGLIDEDFTLASDVNNCGQCGNACGIPNSNIATYACIASTCGIGTCSDGFANCDQSYATGCETDVANGTTINGVLTNCGACNQVCTIVHGTATCVAGQCNVGVCDDDGVHHWQDCYPDSVDGGAGCETDTNVTVSDCATCGHACANRPNSSPVCSSAACSYTCYPGYFDVNGTASDGCEYQCVVTNGGVDVPDDAYTDDNCDGIDGDISKAIFVDGRTINSVQIGNDSYPGTRAQPKRTIQAAIDATVNTNKTHIYVADGTYTGTVTLKNGISVYGAYSGYPNWSRQGAFATTIQSDVVTGDRVIAMQGSNLTEPTTVGYVTVRAQLSVSTSSINLYGVYCASCGGLTLTRTVVFADSGSPGAPGSPGSTGAGGVNGPGGNGGSCDGSNGGTVSGGARTCNTPQVGSTDPATANRYGGTGGQGGPEGHNSGTAGGSGAGGTSGGAGGSASQCQGNRGGDGASGASGGGGASGPGGAAGSAMVTGFWMPNAGGAGGNGAHGNGGGGGGGGGGQGESGCCAICNNGGGNGGGGGGAGGCGGTGGTGGLPGGSSFALFLVDSANVTLTNSNFTSGSGGAGGKGGDGGGGGGGSSGGYGANTCTGEVGGGGNGGGGGSGGGGGGGGGGAGGVSYGLYKVNSSVVTNNVIFAHGPGGTGGAGGAGANAGGAGSTGIGAPNN